MTIKIPTLGDDIRDVYDSAIEEHIDPVEAVRDYGMCHDANFSRTYAEFLIRHHVTEYRAQQERKGEVNDGLQTPAQS